MLCVFEAHTGTLASSTFCELVLAPAILRIKTVVFAPSCPAPAAPCCLPPAFPTPSVHSQKDAPLASWTHELLEGCVVVIMLSGLAPNPARLLRCTAKVG